MQIPSNILYKILVENGITEIYHANSVLTACQFLRAGALLSRGTVERRGMFQTPQSSDVIDRKHSVWFDVFVDSVDIHQRAGIFNAYGPALFVIDSAIIKETYTGGVWVTKMNPTKWSGLKHNEKWFTSAEDLRANFVKGRFDQMIVFRHCGGELPFGIHLKEVILDDPQFQTSLRTDIHSMARGALLLARTEGGIDVKIKRRKCSVGCKCIGKYKNKRKWMIEVFTPHS
jgi:hypothetical protein